MNKTILTTAIVSAVTGGVVGGAITYMSVNKALRTRYEDWANEEIDSVKARYALMHKDKAELDILAMAQNPSPEIKAAVSKGREIMEQMGYSIAEEVPTESPKHAKADSETLSIFDQAIPEELEPDEDEAEEDDYKVIEGEPFKITEAQYFQNDEGYELDTLTYYEVDDTLCDESNAQIDRVEETIGTRHLHMFHKDKQAKNSIYIQNDDQQTLYEVILIESSYASVVLGMNDEDLGIKAPKERPKKMKKDAE